MEPDLCSKIKIVDTLMLLTIKKNNDIFFHFQFPLCDGSHNKHNEDTGDNVGPLVLKRKEPLAAK